LLPQARSAYQGDNRSQAIDRHIGLKSWRSDIWKQRATRSGLRTASTFSCDIARPVSPDEQAFEKRARQEWDACPKVAPRSRGRAPIYRLAAQQTF